MAKHIDAKDVRTVKGILDGWQGKLTWDLLVEAIENRTGYKPTRQALSRNEQIKEAFSDRKKSLANTGSFRSRPQSLKLASDRIERQEATIQRLTKENERLLEMFQVWQYNAIKHGIAEAQLNEPMPAIARRD
jgi:hypothetical protein